MNRRYKENSDWLLQQQEKRNSQAVSTSLLQVARRAMAVKEEKATRRRMTWKSCHFWGRFVPFLMLAIMSWSFSQVSGFCSLWVWMTLWQSFAVKMQNSDETRVRLKQNLSCTVNYSVRHSVVIWFDEFCFSLIQVLWPSRFTGQYTLSICASLLPCLTRLQHGECFRW